MLRGQGSLIGQSRGLPLPEANLDASTTAAMQLPVPDSCPMHSWSCAFNKVVRGFCAILSLAAVASMLVDSFRPRFLPACSWTYTRHFGDFSRPFGHARCGSVSFHGLHGASSGECRDYLSARAMVGHLPGLVLQGHFVALGGWLQLVRCSRAAAFVFCV